MKEELWPESQASAIDWSQVCASYEVSLEQSAQCVYVCKQQSAKQEFEHKVEANGLEDIVAAEPQHVEDETVHTLRLRVLCRVQHVLGR